MSATLPIGPLQIVINYSNAGTTVITTGTIVVNDTVPAGSPAGTNASLVLTTLSIVAKAPGGLPVTETPNLTQTLPATWTPGTSAIEAAWSVASGGYTTSFTFAGTFGNNLQGQGPYIMSNHLGINRQAWTAQLGETNVPLTILGARVGTLTIDGDQVTFTLTAGSSATATLVPATGSLTSGSDFNLGPYTSVSGTFTSNMSGNGEFMPSTTGKRAGDAWVTDMSDR